MRTRALWLIWLLALGAALYPRAVVHAQPDYEVPQADPVVPLPLYHDRPEKGGLYLDFEYVMFRQSVNLHHQPIAVTGFFDSDGSITGRVGTFVGNRQPVLFADDAAGPQTYQPGFKLGGGWRFEDGSSIDISYMNLLKSEYSHEETLARPFFRGGPNLEDTFLTAPVFNFPAAYSGPPVKVNLGNNFSTFGIWNAASEMQVQFIQRDTQVDATYRVPIFDTEDWRCYGLCGPRFFWIWERFKWRTVDIPGDGTLQGPFDAAIYTNIVSNRMYGAFIGAGNECYLGHGFAVSLDLEATLYLDIVKERAKYELGEKDAPFQAKRARIDYAIVPEVRANLNLWWYPIEGVQVRLGYDLMAFFNTVGMPEPVSFNYGALDPPWQRVTRFFDGLEVGIGFIF